MRKSNIKLKAILVVNGNGEPLVVCDTCQGKGRAFVPASEPFRANTNDRCPTCRGAGMVRIAAKSTKRK